MSYMGSKDRFSGKARRQVEEKFEADQGKAEVAYQAMSQVNSAEDAIRAAASRLQQAAADVLAQLDSGSHVYDRSIASVGEDLNRAIALRQQGFMFLAAVLSQDEIRAAMNAS